MELFLFLGLIGLVVAAVAIALVVGVVLLPVLLLGAIARMGFELLLLPFKLIGLVLGAVVGTLGGILGGALGLVFGVLGLVVGVVALGLGLALAVALGAVFVLTPLLPVVALAAIVCWLARRARRQNEPVASL